ncbi:MAG: hypothetical protein Q8P67_09995, partial [archaeon]|nr:hypothetical protein [archaeon]
RKKEKSLENNQNFKVRRTERNGKFRRSCQQAADWLQKMTESRRGKRYHDPCSPLIGGKRLFYEDQNVGRAGQGN